MLEETESPMKNEILDSVANSSAVFKSQQKDEPELTIEEKYKIANNLLDKSHVLFLSKFGKYLNVKLLDYFTETNDYELTHYVKKLKRYFNNETRDIDIKNRRYEALKLLIEKQDYFSEIEMMKRNPLLYDHLIGKYLTEDDIKTRDDLDTKNITFVNLLMEKIDRDGIKCLKKKQQDDEDEVFEEFDSDSDESDDEEKNNIKWGEMDGCSGNKLEDDNKINNSKKNIQCFDIDYEEQQMLKKEFITYMYQSFLDGNDKDFDYRFVLFFKLIYNIKSIIIFKDK